VRRGAPAEVVARRRDGYVLAAKRPPAGVAEWQTRQTQNLLSERTWGFKSLHPHQHMATRTDRLEEPEAERLANPTHHPLQTPDRSRVSYTLLPAGVDRGWPGR
jgi:hypothetical protein